MLREAALISAAAAIFAQVALRPRPRGCELAPPNDRGSGLSVSMVDQPLLAVLTLRETWRRVRRRLRTGPLHRWRFAGSGPARLVIVPPNLRYGDPITAEAIYAGRFHFAGQLVEPGRSSIFETAPPSRAFAAELDGFGWLRHHAEVRRRPRRAERPQPRRRLHPPQGPHDRRSGLRAGGCGPPGDFLADLCRYPADGRGGRLLPPVHGEPRLPDPLPALDRARSRPTACRA